MALFQNSALKKYLYPAAVQSGEGFYIQHKTKAQALEAAITRLEREIDALVYELYGLTEEEIRIVEGNT